MLKRAHALLVTLLSTLILLTAACRAETPAASATGYGNRLAGMPADLARVLAEKDKPAANGAMGRNRQGYFHVRFQLGMHNLAHYAIVAREPRAFALFVDAAEYAFAHQQADGSFDIVLPTALRGRAQPGPTDLASGTAFFIASLGSGWLALTTSDWAQTTPELEPLRRRLAALQPRLDLALAHLLRQRALLLRADRKAPNRLLFDALAYYSAGRLLAHDEALAAAEIFVAAATAQVADDGYFIEGGGADTSYNGVALSLALRLLTMGYDDAALADTAESALRWQLGRIADNGAISTAGNTRVSPERGEQFLGRTKDVDAGQMIEALMLAAIRFEKPAYLDVARSIYRHYRERQTD